jgi:hypothetical protein
MERLQGVLRDKGAGTAVTVVVAETSPPVELQSLLGSLLTHNPAEPGGRVCILLSPGAVGPKNIQGAEIESPAWTAIEEAEVEKHLVESWGLSAEEAHKTATTVGSANLDLCSQPGRLYTYIERTYVEWNGGT